MSARDAGILLGVPIDRKSLNTATAEALAAIETAEAAGNLCLRQSSLASDSSNRPDIQIGSKQCRLCRR